MLIEHLLGTLTVVTSGNGIDCCIKEWVTCNSQTRLIPFLPTLCTIHRITLMTEL